MNKPSFPVVLLLGVTLGCAALFLLWLRQDARPPASAATATSARTLPAPAPAHAPPSASATPAKLSPQARALLAELARLFARGGVREREAVLTFKDDAALQRFLARAPKSGLTVVGQLDRLRAVRVRVDSLDTLGRDLAGFEADYGGIDANALLTLPRPPAKQDRADVTQVPFGNDTLTFIGATGDRSNWGRGTTIAILDSGVAADVTFGASRLRTLDVGLGSAPGTGANDGHGTGVAALAAGLAADAGGVAPAASLLSIRVTDATGTSDLFTVSSAIVAAVDAGARIINLSLGGHATGPVLDAAIDYATRQGALLVAAAGNDQAAQLAWPAADPRVVSVGAIDKLEQQVTFSNSGEQLQLTAPGYGVQTAWLDGQRVYVSGTSASAPLVAGAIAALVSQNPSLTPRQAADLLALTANDGGTPGADPAYGRGILNLATAMNYSNPSYVDTAISSHSYDAASNQMQFVVQNRSGRTVTGISLAITTGGITSTQSVPSLSPGETYVARAPVDDLALKAGKTLSFSTRLTNPVGVVDQVPTNNQRSSALSPNK